MAQKRVLELLLQSCLVLKIPGTTVTCSMLAGRLDWTTGTVYDRPNNVLGMTVPGTGYISLHSCRTYI